MTKTELIKCFAEDRASNELKDRIANIVKKLNKNSGHKIFAGVEESSFYVIDSEYHIFCERTHITISKEYQDPWLPNYYEIRGGDIHKKSYCYNFKQMETDITERLKKYLK